MGSWSTDMANPRLIFIMCVIVFSSFCLGLFYQPALSSMSLQPKFKENIYSLLDMGLKAVGAGPFSPLDRVRLFSENHTSSAIGGDLSSVIDPTQATGSASYTNGVFTCGAGNKIAIGCGITFRGSEHTSLKNIPFFGTFLPSFCATASVGYEYSIYLAHDSDDVYFKLPDSYKKIRETFDDILQAMCPPSINTTTLHFVSCQHQKSPAWAQNDAMMEAYFDNVNFFYRINDDTRLVSRNWTAAFIEALCNFNPPLVGVVGPKHTGGNLAILTHDFVHRSHIDIFGHYYPSVFLDWYADSWITAVYKPNRSRKLANITVAHTMSKGTRYDVRQGVKGYSKPQITRDQHMIQKYLEAAHLLVATTSPTISTSAGVVNKSRG